MKSTYVINFANAVFSGLNLICSFIIEITLWAYRIITNASKKETLSAKENIEYSKYFWFAVVICIIPVLAGGFFLQKAYFFILLYYSLLLPLSLGVIVLSPGGLQLLTPDITQLWQNLIDFSVIVILDFLILIAATGFIWVKYLNSTLNIPAISAYILTISTLFMGICGGLLLAKMKDKRPHLFLYQNMGKILADRPKNLNALQETTQQIEAIAFQAQKDGEKTLLLRCVKRLEVLYERLFSQMESKTKRSEVRKLRAEKGILLKKLKKHAGKK